MKSQATLYREASHLTRATRRLPTNFTLQSQVTQFIEAFLQIRATRRVATRLQEATRMADAYLLDIATLNHPALQVEAATRHLPPDLVMFLASMHLLTPTPVIRRVAPHLMGKAAFVENPPSLVVTPHPTPSLNKPRWLSIR